MSEKGCFLRIGTSAGALLESLSAAEFFEGYSIPRITKSFGADCFRFTDNFLRASFPTNRPLTRQVAGQVTALVRSIRQDGSSRKELMLSLTLRGRDNFEKLYLSPALEAGLIEYTVPEKPNSRLQKYRLTEKGRALIHTPRPKRSVLS